MKGIKGNLKGYIQVRTTTTNEIGEQVEVWQDVQRISGWLDMLTGDSGTKSFLASIQESTHIFVADYVRLNDAITSENSRMIINGNRYTITFIDNPMEMKHGSQLEIYLKFTGGQ